MKLFCRHYGSGDPLILLHGLFGLSDNWVSFGRQMSGHFEIFIPDIRNHGQSPHSPVFDLPSMEEDLMELIEEYHIKNLNLLGHSLGGKIVMLFALHHPEIVRKLVVVDIGLRKAPPQQGHQQLINAMMQVDFSTAASRTDVDRQLAQAIPDPRIRQLILKNLYWSDRQTLGWRMNLKAIDENLPAVYESIESMDSYPGPALFIRGGLSGYISETDVGLIKMKFPGSVVETIRNASHWVHADTPGEFFKCVSDFLKG